METVPPFPGPDPIKELATNVNSELKEWLLFRRWVPKAALDEAESRFLEALNKNKLREAALLKLLTWEMDTLDEERLLLHQVHQEEVGFFALQHYKLSEDLVGDFSLHECWASLTLPFDFQSNCFFVASCSYLSKTNREHWEQRLRRKIIWYATDLSTLTMALEKLSDPPSDPKEEGNTNEPE